MYGLAKSAKKVSLVGKVDAIRLKRNLAYCIFQGGKQEFEVFKKGSKAVIEHAFNNHEYCGQWCQAKNLTKEEIAEKNLCLEPKKEMMVKSTSKLKKRLDHIWKRNH